MSQVQAASAQNTTDAQATQSDANAVQPKENLSLVTQDPEKVVAEAPKEPTKTDEPKSEVKPTQEASYELVPPKDLLLPQDKVDEIVSFAKERGLSKDQAQALLERENSSAQYFKSTLTKEIENTTQSVWPKETQSDVEVGGANFKDSVSKASQVIKDFGTPELIELLNKTGIGNHKEVVRVFSRIGKAYAEDSFVQPGAQSVQKKSAADVLYGGTK